ncbi:MAG: RidA family protein [Bacillota bacterium]
MKAISTPKAPNAIGPYSQAITAGGMIYVSGQIPVNPKTGELETEITKATAQAIENIKAILEASGSSLAKVCKTTVFLKSLNDFVPMNEVYAQYFTEPFPARACFEVGKLPKDAVVEIECVAEV